MFIFKFIFNLVTAPIRIAGHILYSLFIGAIQITLLIVIGLFSLEYGGEKFQAAYQTHLEGGIKKIEVGAAEAQSRVPAYIRHTIASFQS